jgi:hypothetical protein
MMESSKSLKTRITLTVEEEDLADKDKDIVDLVLSFDLFKLHQLSMQNFRDLVDHYHAWESDLAKFIVPQVYEFPEFVVWCAVNYIPSQRSVISKNGLVLFVINSESISEMLNLPLNPERETLDEIILSQCFIGLSSQDRVSLLQSYLCQNLDTPTILLLLKLIHFLKHPSKSLQ